MSSATDKLTNPSKAEAALGEPEKRESLSSLVRDLVEQYGEPGKEEIEWANRVLSGQQG